MNSILSYDQYAPHYSNVLIPLTLCTVCNRPASATNEYVGGEVGFNAAGNVPISEDGKGEECGGPCIEGGGEAVKAGET